MFHRPREKRGLDQPDTGPPPTTEAPSLHSPVLHPHRARQCLRFAWLVGAPVLTVTGPQCTPGTPCAALACTARRPLKDMPGLNDKSRQGVCRSAGLVFGAGEGFLFDFTGYVYSLEFLSWNPAPTRKLSTFVCPRNHTQPQAASTTYSTQRNGRSIRPTTGHGKGPLRCPVNTCDVVILPAFGATLDEMKFLSDKEPVQDCRYHLSLGFQGLGRAGPPPQNQLHLHNPRPMEARGGGCNRQAIARQALRKDHDGKVRPSGPQQALYCV